MTHAKGGFYHDGRFADLAAVVEHYNQFLKLSLSDAEKHDLAEYLKSLWSRTTEEGNPSRWAALPQDLAGASRSGF